MLTLGFEPDMRITKTAIAQTQLIEAIDLFLAGRYISATTLAGAAEEIFARLLNQNKEASVVEKSFQAIHEIRERLGIAAMGTKTKNEIFNEWNAARNALKHHGKTDDETITINLFDEAYWMIQRAIENAKALGVRISNQLDFENWIIQNINM